MSNDQESLQFWSTLLQTLSGSDPKDDLCPKISRPILAMSTSMTAYVPPERSNAPGDGGNTRLGKAIDKSKDKNINDGGQISTGKRIEVEKKEDATEEMKPPRKRVRTSEARNVAEKRRRTNIKTKLENLKQLTPNCNQKDNVSALDCIIDYIRSMKHYVESLSMGPMLPLGINMDFPAPRGFPFIHPNFIMPPPPFNDFIPGETSTSDDNQQIVPVNDQEFNNQPHSSKSM